MSKRTPLYETELAAGAAFGEWFGWELPARFGDPAIEHRAVRETVGLIDLSHRAILELAGKDRTRFLNGMVTNDVKSLKPGSGQYAAMLTTHGKLMADMRIYALADAYWLDLHEELIPKTREALDRHIIADQVDLTDRSGEVVMVAIQGPASLELLAGLGIAGAKSLAEYQHLETSIKGAGVRIIRASETGEEGFIAVAPAPSSDTVWQALMEAGRAHQLRLVGMEALNLLRVEAGIPWHGLDMDENTLLQEVGLERAVSFSKGCYIGQETVARVAHRGHVNRHLTGLLIEGTGVPVPGTKLLRELQEVGRITSAVRSPTLGHAIALGYVRREWMTPGTILELETLEGIRSAETVPLPFYKRK
jgi:glycine cleavage system T protein